MDKKTKELADIYNNLEKKRMKLYKIPVLKIDKKDSTTLISFQSSLDGQTKKFVSWLERTWNVSL